MRLALLALTVSTLPLHGAYTYWITDYGSSIDANRWDNNGTLAASAAGFYKSTTPDGTLILKSAVPDGSSDYEVRAKLTLATNGGSYFLFLRASQNAQVNPTGAPNGTLIGIEVKDPGFH